MRPPRIPILLLCLCNCAGSMDSGSLQADLVGLMLAAFSEHSRCAQLKRNGRRRHNPVAHGHRCNGKLLVFVERRVKRYHHVQNRSEWRAVDSLWNGPCGQSSASSCVERRRPVCIELCRQQSAPLWDRCFGLLVSQRHILYRHRSYRRGR